MAKDTLENFLKSQQAATVETVFGLIADTIADMVELGDIVKGASLHWTSDKDNPGEYFLDISVRYVKEGNWSVS